jgi:hypothetical protein
LPAAHETYRMNSLDEQSYHCGTTAYPNIRQHVQTLSPQIIIRCHNPVYCTVKPICGLSTPARPKTCATGRGRAILKNASGQLALELY